MFVVFKRLSIFILLVSLLIVLGQDIMIFPGVFRGVPTKIPVGVEQHKVQTEDKETIEVLYMKGEQGKSLSGYSAIFVHGNFETVYSSVIILKWLSSLGLNSYVYDFRGYGNSTGWPSEKGLYLDGKAVWSFIKEKEHIDANKLFVVGNSIGTGIAAELASHIQPYALLLVAPFVDLARVVEQNYIFRPLIPFLWYQLPTLQYLKEIKNTCLILAHGKNDNVIDISNSEEIYNVMKENRDAYYIVNAKSGHNDIIFRARDDISNALVECVSQ